MAESRKDKASILVKKSTVWRWGGMFAALTLLSLVVCGLPLAGRFLEAPAAPPVPADLMVVLGGDTGDRGLTVVRLYAAQMAPRVLLTGLEGSPPETRPAYLNWRVRVLADAGVPLEQMEFDEKSANSWEEAVNTRRLMETRGWHKALVVSDPHHMRRLSWVWGRVFEGSRLEFSLVASQPAYWQADAWWRDEKSGQGVIVEYIKLAYYLAKY